MIIGGSRRNTIIKHLRNGHLRLLSERRNRRKNDVLTRREYASWISPMTKFSTVHRGIYLCYYRSRDILVFRLWEMISMKFISATKSRRCKNVELSKVRETGDPLTFVRRWRFMLEAEWCRDNNVTLWIRLYHFGDIENRSEPCNNDGHTLIMHLYASVYHLYTSNR